MDAIIVYTASEADTWLAANYGGTVTRSDCLNYVRLSSATVEYYNDENDELQRYSFTSSYSYSDFASTLGTDDYANWAWGSYYTVEQRVNNWYAGIPTYFVCTPKDKSSKVEYIPVNTYVSYDKKAKPEVLAAVYPSAEEGSQGGYFSSGRFYVNAPAPCTIAEPKQPKDKGITIVVQQPEFDYLGNSTVSGCVYMYGPLQTTTKETKNAVTLTASNPSTNKKASLKATVSGKVVPEFKKAGTFTFDTSVLDEANEYDEYFISSGYYDMERTKISAKRAAIPKQSSLKFKADGSKTIVYRPGLYNDYNTPDGYSAYSYARSKFTGDPKLWNYMYQYVIDHSLWTQFGEQFNAELEEKLLALGLSFDVKKGTVVLAAKSGKTTPTLNSAGNSFESLDIAVTASNDVETAQAWGELAITGEKPRAADRTVSIYGAVQKGDVFTFKLLAGTTIAESERKEGGTINVRSYTASDTDTKTLSDWGLELVNYDSMDILVSDEVTLDSGETVLSGDKWIRSKDVSYINYGLIQVIDPDTLAKVLTDAASADTKGKALKKLAKGSRVNLILDNLGAVVKGNITVALLSNITSAGDPANYNGALPGHSTAPSDGSTGHSRHSRNSRQLHSHERQHSGGTGRSRTRRQSYFRKGKNFCGHERGTEDTHC